MYLCYLCVKIWSVLHVFIGHYEHKHLGQNVSLIRKTVLYAAFIRKWNLSLISVLYFLQL